AGPVPIRHKAAAEILRPRLVGHRLQEHVPGRFWEPPQSRALRTACEDRIGTAFLEVVDHSVVVIGPEGRRNELDLRQRDSGPAEQYCEPGIEHVGYTNDADGDPLTTEIVVIRDAIFHPKIEATRVQPRQHD